MREAAPTTYCACHLVSQISYKQLLVQNGMTTATSKQTPWIYEYMNKFPGLMMKLMILPMMVIVIVVMSCEQIRRSS